MGKFVITAFVVGFIIGWIVGVSGAHIDPNMFNGRMSG